MAEGPFCSFSKYSPISCGNSKHYRFDQEYVSPRTCSRDISSHLRRLETSREINIKSECHLILLRAGLFEEEGDSFTICPQHRDVLGTLWNSSRPAKKCCHPLHGTSRAKRARNYWRLLGCAYPCWIRWIYDYKKWCLCWFSRHDCVLQMEEC